MQNLNAVFDVTNYGVAGDGKTNNTAKIAEVIGLAEKAGGGIIYFPPGEYVSGTIELKSNMTLYLSAGTVILGSENREDNERHARGLHARRSFGSYQGDERRERDGYGSRRAGRTRL